jgi:hypothetical protein
MLLSCLSYVAPAAALTSPLTPHHSPLTTRHKHTGKPIELFWINNFVSPQELVRQTTTPLRNNRFG